VFCSVTFHHELEGGPHLAGEPVRLQTLVGDGGCGLERVFRDLARGGERGTGGVTCVPGSTDSPQATKPRARSTIVAPRLNESPSRRRAFITSSSVVSPRSHHSSAPASRAKYFVRHADSVPHG
jgi:hypothetical protein